MSKENDQTVCPITREPCMGIKCAWWISDYDEDVPGLDYSDCAIQKTFEYVMIIAERD